MADAPTTPTPREDDGVAAVSDESAVPSDDSLVTPGSASEGFARDESEDEPTPGLSVPDGQNTQSKPSRYQGSAFHQSRYQGIQDAISWQDENRRRQRKRDRFRQSIVTVMLVVGALLGGVTGGSFAVWSLTSDGIVQAGQFAPPTISVTNPDDATPITAVAASALPKTPT